MNKKNDAQVVINGKPYNIAGYENVEYLHRIADYINKKQAELREQVRSNIINDSERNILIMINIADDYLKLKDREETGAADLDRQREINALKKELAETRRLLEKAEEENKVLKNKK